ncbi:Sec1 family protein [archaeon]|nr:MAG: Sec1 family protein [archaeon]
MKVLLLDQATKKVVSMVYSQTQVLEKEVYLIELLGVRHESMSHLKAAVFVQPTEANYDLLVRELAEPKYKEYHLFFNNVVPQDMLARLARLDEQELIMQIQEYYADYQAINEDFFHLGIDNSLILSSASRTLESGQVFERNVNGILSVLLSLKKIPSQIRYQSSSELARRLASDVLTNIEKGEPFDFRRQDGVMLMILDRRDDPITPLLTQWTYQAMVHELLGLNNNRVILRGAPGITKELEEVVLSATQDDFFRRHRFANFGDLGVAVKQLLDDYQKLTKKNENINSIEDMQSFLERYPDFRSKSINVSKHVAVISELSRLTDLCQLLDISEVEQEIACNNDRSTHKQDLLGRIRNPKVKMADKVRMSILYILRYESYDDLREIKQALAEKGVQVASLSLLDAVLEYAGEAKRAPGLFSQGGIMAKLTKTFNSVGGVQNVYTQHQPVLFHIMQNILNGKLKDSAFPPLLTAGGSGTNFRPTEVIIFMVGGATFEESTRVAEFNAANNGIKIMLGGSCVQNSTSFLKEIGTVFGR